MISGYHAQPWTCAGHAQAVKRSLEREKDLEGIDMSNIVSGRRRGRQQAAAQPVNYRCATVSYGTPAEACTYITTLGSHIAVLCIRLVRSRVTSLELADEELD